MNADVLKGQWKEIKGEVRRQWGKLTDNEIDEVNGNAEKLAGQLQKKYGYSKDEAKRQVDNFMQNRQPRERVK